MDTGRIYDEESDSEFFMSTDDETDEAREEMMLAESESTEETGDMLNEREERSNITPEEFGLKGESGKNIYCDKEELYNEIWKYQKDGKASEKLGELLIKIALHMSTMARFWRYSHDIKEELVGHAIMQLLMSVPKFNLKDSKKNPFGYLSMICYRDMLHTLKKHFKPNKLKESVIEAKIGRLSNVNPCDERLAMLRATLERNEEYSNFMKNEQYPFQPKEVDTFALSKSEQMRRRNAEAKKGGKRGKSAKNNSLNVKNTLKRTMRKS